MRVLFLVTDDWFFWSHRVGLARAVRDAGCEVTVVTSEGSLRGRIEAEGFAFEPLAFRRDLVGQWKNLRVLRDLVRLFRRRRPDIVHNVSFLPIFWGTLAARRAGVPAVVNAVTGLGRLFIEGRRPSPLRWLVERAYARVLSGPRTRAVFQNPDDARLFRERGLVPAENAVLVFGSGVDTERFRPAPEPGGPPVVLFASRMLWSKGVGELVEASRRLRGRGVEHELDLVGQPHDANPDSVPEETLRGWHASGTARWLGHRTDMPERFRAAHVVCLPSYYREGVPLALLEAAATGRPLVTTDMPGCREIVRDGENGLLVPPRDAAALADALERLLDDADLRRAMGAAARKHVEERFSQAVVNAAILEIYRGLAGSRWPADPAGEASDGPAAVLPSARPTAAQR